MFINTRLLATASKFVLPVAGVGTVSGVVASENQGKNYYWNKWVDESSRSFDEQQDYLKKMDDLIIQTKEESKEPLQQAQKENIRLQEENIKLKQELENTKKEKEFLVKLKLEEKENLELFKAYLEGKEHR